MELKQRKLRTKKTKPTLINRIHCGIETILHFRKPIPQEPINRIHCGIETYDKKL